MKEFGEDATKSYPTVLQPFPINVDGIEFLPPDESDFSSDEDGFKSLGRPI